MVLWRISRHKDLSGIGGLKAGGRWHHAGHPVVYLADSPAGALLEVCVHTAANDVPPDFTLLRIEGPDLKFNVVHESDLPPDWVARLDVTRSIGAAWLDQRASVLLQVPSALVPQTANFLLNPLHPEAKRFHITEALRYPFDLRLKK